MNLPTPWQQSELTTDDHYGMRPSPEEGGVDVWAVVLRRKWFLVLGLLLGLGLGYLALLQSDPVYESVAQVMVEKRTPPTLTDNVMAMQQLEFGYSGESKHAIMMRSPKIVAQAFREFRLAEYRALGEDEIDAMKNIMENVEITPVDDSTEVFDIRFRCSDPDAAQKVVESIYMTYGLHLKEFYETQGGEAKNFFEQMKQEYEEAYDALAKEIEDHRRNMPSDLLRDPDGNIVSLHDDSTVMINTGLGKAKEQMRDLRAEYETLQAAIVEGIDPEVLLGNVRDSETHQSPEFRRQMLEQEKLLPLLLMEEQLKSEFAEDHPEVKNIRRQISRVRDILGSDLGLEDGEGKSAGYVAEDAAKQLEAYILWLRQEIRKAELQIKMSSEELAIHQTASDKRQDYINQDRLLKTRFERMDRMLEVTIDKLAETSAAADYDGYLFDPLAAASPGEEQMQWPKYLGIGSMLGLMLGFGIGYLIEVSDKGFRSSDEVSQILRVPVIGHVPLIDPKGLRTLPDSTIDVMIRTVHSPKSTEAEAYRTVRTALYFSTAGTHCQVMQVTSPTPGDGKSTLTTNLAVTIAQSGKTILLIDADLRKPRQHKIFGVDNKVGLSNVVVGEMDPQETVQTFAEVPNLSLITSGPRPANPSELLSSQRFHDMVEMLRDQYDFVLIDSPPILAVSDPGAIAPRVDGVLLTFRVHKKARPLAIQAKNALLQRGGNVIGVVVNGVGGDIDTGYKYYGYRYNYRPLQYGKYGGYYTDDEEGDAQTPLDNVTLDRNIAVGSNRVVEIE